MSKLQQIVETVHKYLPDSATAAVILAAGDSKRMGHVNKLFYNINGVPVLAHSLIAYQKCPLIREIVVVAKPEDFSKIRELKRTYGITKLTKLANGGQTRQESAKNGIEKLGDEVFHQLFKNVYDDDVKKFSLIVDEKDGDVLIKEA